MKGGQILDMVGQRFERLTVLHLNGQASDGKALWLCQCVCGGTITTRGQSLRKGNTKSCGCLRREHSKRMIALATSGRDGEWQALLDTLCEVVTRFPQQPKELYNALLNTWGSCHQRRFWRALSTLVKQGRIVQSGCRQHNGNSDEASAYLLPPVPWAENLASCISEAAAAWAVLDLGVRRAA